MSESSSSYSSSDSTSEDESSYSSKNKDTETTSSKKNKSNNESSSIEEKSSNDNSDSSSSDYTTNSSLSESQSDQNSENFNDQKSNPHHEPKESPKSSSKNESNTSEQEDSTSPSIIENSSNSSSNNSLPSKTISTTAKDEIYESSQNQEPPPKFDFSIVADGIDKNQKADRYGWALDGRKLSKEEEKLQQKESEKERSREKKWLYMTRKENWKDFFYGKNRKILEERVLKGIPDCLRSLGWKLILDPKSINNPKRPSVQSFFDKGEPPCDYVIRVDIPRTMPRVPMFTEADVRTSLYTILRAYSNADPELGYFQGMGFPAAILRTYMEETEAFWCFHNLMRGKKHMVRNYYDHEFENLRKICTVWDFILEKKFPLVHKQLKSLGVDHMIYTPSWFLCAFMNINFPPVLKLRIFDRFAMFGTRALLSLGMAIIDIHKKEIAKGGMDVCVPILQNPPDSPKMKDWRKILKYYDRNFLNRHEYKKFFRKLNIPVLP
ncbi:TBC domain containing protein [Tritrichomonas foetus]|uniref:TBC domain containing protein n=1 Tax=Tritrichomonas foetus TaxID=1144522 RepID=A0A1J4JZ55_9EUKA|nr:TBC domain containing protein [Tritrichomonas foetus]|eukprot:OHT03768.1 TBC domain containing protein [Tritrichomonas foetus]